MRNLLLFFWQTGIPETKPNTNYNEFGLYIAIASCLSAIFGAALKSLIDYFVNRPKVKSDINLTDSATRKNDNEIISNLQERFLSSQRLLMEMQENLDKWIKRFEKNVDEASEVEDELRKVRRNCNDCLNGRKDYYEFCKDLNPFMVKVEAMFNQMANEHSSPILKELKGLMEDMAELQQCFEEDNAIINQQK